MSLATIILAAGASNRLGGQPKQLLTQDGTSLIQRIVQTALSLKAGPVIVVLGANQSLIQPVIQHLPVQLVTNPNWQEGLASSLHAGLTSLTDTSIESFLVLLTDQPFVTVDLLQKVINTQQQTGKGIVACRYGNPDHLGVPALFSISYRSTFMQLSGDVGARKLIQQHADDCAEVAFDLGTIDLDTWADVEKWQGGPGAGVSIDWKA
ncbi:nucleotidyltransferase family protein [Spirosoma aerolatum]|uniref:nucleotidyltransferase family protein n=1 Tax=Spirosoma aerolatum TaxID=1211326 RepID=UPI0009ADE06E|nr:nucleotidyltransferase family protein [Spirosoma aerolatum]